jgi:hypothetical protein
LEPKLLALTPLVVLKGYGKVVGSEDIGAIEVFNEIPNFYT